ncbi:hypothetical protein MYP_1713 [Sporocytophaga myxococcoides]|uniref:Uncharacterized protein n=1 Tax=Sporocytophaga myxococcoides TaxID=153721 RepID=A0A098LC10_9BACT|nr:hypothetical protein [Sporocytophaga myxococcoides]GAL84485.1 hypothetical protein MYP_1713 [Sporocytophaga myxococcoides]
MNQLNDKERELIKLTNHFRKKAELMIEEGTLSDEFKSVVEACERLSGIIYEHAETRKSILNKREILKNIVKDNASCPHCSSNEHLKYMALDVNEKGWKFNKYKCRRCNISFVWNRPNNPWDMLAFIDHLKADFMLKIMNNEVEEDEKMHSLEMIKQLDESLYTLKPVIEQSDLEAMEMDRKDQQVSTMIAEFTKYLQIQKILIS